MKMNCPAVPTRGFRPPQSCLPLDALERWQPARLYPCDAFLFNELVFPITATAPPYALPIKLVSKLTIGFDVVAGRPRLPAVASGRGGHQGEGQIFNETPNSS